MQFSSIYYAVSPLIIECLMKITETFMKILHTKYIFVYHEQTKKTSIDILRVMLDRHGIKACCCAIGCVWTEAKLYQRASRA
jgi:hypothetical protein